METRERKKFPVITEWISYELLMMSELFGIRIVYLLIRSVFCLCSLVVSELIEHYGIMMLTIFPRSGAQ